MSSERLDQRVVSEGLAPTRDKAKALILTGVVLVNDTPQTKAGTRVKSDAHVRLKSGSKPLAETWVSRGALKLAPALETFGVDPTGRICLDIGASTGGFTEVLLRGGAHKVFAVDVGYGQLAWRVRNDKRVVVLERVNARNLTVQQVPDKPTLLVMDVSFISVTKILPALAGVLGDRADLLVMVKPQFEVGRGRVGKGGVVRDESLRQEAIDGVAAFAETLQWTVLGRRDNDVRGPKGNLETFLHIQKGL